MNNIRKPLNRRKEFVSMNQEYNKEYFDRTAKGVGLTLKSRRPVWSRWVKIIRTHKPNGKLLDVGCGAGWFLSYAEKHYDTYGVDASEYAIEEAKAKTHNTKLSVGDAQRLYYVYKSFDVVTCFDLLEHLSNPYLAIAEFHRVLKDNGVLVVRVPNTESVGSKLKGDDWFGARDETHVSLFGNKTWIKMIKHIGFTIETIFYDGLWDTPYYKRIPKILQDITIKYPSLVLFMLGVKFSQKFGENLCIVAKKEATKSSGETSYDNEERFKRYWRSQIIMGKIFEKKCIKCSHVDVCYGCEGATYNKSAIEELCRNKKMIEAVRELQRINDEHGCQIHCVGNELQNRWYEEVKGEVV